MKKRQRRLVPSTHLEKLLTELYNPIPHSEPALPMPIFARKFQNQQLRTIVEDIH